MVLGIMKKIIAVTIFWPLLLWWLLWWWLWWNDDNDDDDNDGKYENGCQGSASRLPLVALSSTRSELLFFIWFVFVLLSLCPNCSQRLSLHLNLFDYRRVLSSRQTPYQALIPNPSTSYKENYRRKSLQRQNFHFPFKSWFPLVTQLSATSVWFLITASDNRSNCSVRKSQ